MRLTVARAAGVGFAGVVILASAAYALSLRPDIPWSRLEAKYASPASRFVDMPGGIRLHYRDQGEGPGTPLVLIHGFAASLQAWEPWVARLSHGRRVVTLDLPGHGLTRAPADYAPSIGAYAELVEALSRRLNLGPYVVAGNSMGGAVAWKLAMTHPEDIRGLVLIDAAGWPGEKPAAGGGPLVFRLLSSPLGRLLLRNVDTRPLAAGGLKDAYIDQALVTPALVDRYVELSRAPGHRAVLLRVVTQGQGPETAASFRALRTPTLVMHGREDRLVPFSDGQAFAETIPHAQLIAYDGVGHVPMEQIPDRSAKDLGVFLQEVDAGRGTPTAPVTDRRPR